MPLELAKAESKKARKKQLKLKKIAPFTGIQRPMPQFPPGFKHLEKFVVETAKSLSEQNKGIYEHIKAKECEPQDIMAHLFNTNRNIDRVLYLMVMALHSTWHAQANTSEILKVKKAVMELDTSFHKHEPKLQYIDKHIQDHLDREKRADKIYG